MPIIWPTVDLSSVDLSSKTTQQGLLSGLFGLCSLASVILAVLSPAHPGCTGYAIASAVVGFLTTSLKAKIGVGQKDAGEQLALVPGAAAPQVVPSHEIPDQAKAVPITDSANFPTPTKQ